jgi:uncharacterized membrane protein (UPF0127 family)
MTRPRSFATLVAMLAVLVPHDEPAHGTQRVIAARPLDSFPRERIAVETRGARRYVFEAWRADTDETRAQGLMFVQHLDPVQAMLFVYEPPQPVSMWMRNTYIPLDMLFADSAGCIVNIAANTTPRSLESIPAAKPVGYVVEIAGGLASARGITVGDRIVRFEVEPQRQDHVQPCTR